MDYNLLTNLQYCKDIVDGLMSFILYAHIPSAVVALIVGGYVLYKTRSLTGRVLFALAAVFSLWVGLNLSVWLNYGNASPLMVTWSLIGLLTAIIFILVFYFVYVLVFEKNMPGWMFAGWSILLIPVLYFTSTNFNLIGYDIRDCVAVENTMFTNYYYGIGVLVFLLLPVIGYIGWKRVTTANKGGIPMVIAGAELFLLAFFTTGVIATYLVDNNIISDFGLELYGIMAMAVFMTFLGYVIVKYQEFRIKLIATQALVVAIVILIATGFTFAQNTMSYVLVGVTLALAAITGYLLIGSVKKEIDQRERIEKLAKELEVSNEQLSEFMSLATHEIRNPATFIKGLSAGALEGDLGELPPKIKDGMQKIFVRINDIIHLGNQYLDKSKLELNQLKYEFTPLDLGKLVEDLVRESQPTATQYGITATFAIDKSADYTVQADSGKIKEVIENLIDNAIKYTPKGSVTASVLKGDSTVTVKIADTGNGIPAEVIPQLFKKFSRADAQKANLSGTGLGLYLAKIFIDAHHGRIWVESPGKDNGSTFYVELPVNQPNTGR